MTQGPPGETDFEAVAAQILEENQRALAGIEPASFGRLLALVESSGRAFVLREGRSGLVARMFAMRLMHLGRIAHVVGETTTPPIRPGDLLVVVSGSGTSRFLRGFAEAAKGVGARSAVLTTDSDSGLGQMGDVTLVIPAAGKLDRTGEYSRQFAGSLFEQAALLLFDSLFVLLAARAGQDTEALWDRHANLE